MTISGIVLYRFFKGFKKSLKIKKKVFTSWLVGDITPFTATGRDACRCCENFRNKGLTRE
jgi:hypothetical protein